jgi:hypothetical protein
MMGRRKWSDRNPENKIHQTLWRKKHTKKLEKPYIENSRRHWQMEQKRKKSKLLK